MIAEDDTVMARVTWSGTNADSGEAASLSAGMIRIEYGQIAESRAVGDQLVRLMAIRGITEDELASVTGEATPVL